MLSIEELGATKAYTIGRRGSYRDYVDMFFILSEAHGTLSGIIELAKRKYGGMFNDRLFLEQLVYFEDIQDTSIRFLKESVSPAIVQEFFVRQVEAMRF